MSKTYEVKCFGLVCPMPVARTKNKMKKMDSGDVLEIRGDFAEAAGNIARYVEKHGGKVIERELDGETYYLKIKKL
jgi:tRNA 2-thiouridine synthesizing protein A